MKLKKWLTKRNVILAVLLLLAVFIAPRLLSLAVSNGNPIVCGPYPNGSWIVQPTYMYQVEGGFSDVEAGRAGSGYTCDWDAYGNILVGYTPFNNNWRCGKAITTEDTLYSFNVQVPANMETASFIYNGYWYSDVGSPTTTFAIEVISG